ncbi:MAG: hypothetical protein K0V04_25290 [Deltaproteobacteria bacterium]|nr:hypothetical protein [Deltaproteobacteria bacterium]
MTADRHLRASLLLIAVFLAVGLGLEAIAGLRPPGWNDDALRRELLRLGHAHGALLGMLNLGVAWAMVRRGTPIAWASRVRIAALSGAAAVGGGFLGGGLWHGPTDPGPLVLAVPAGALLMLCSLVAVALLPKGGADPNPEP